MPKAKLIILSVTSGITLLAAIIIYNRPYYQCVPCGSDICPMICVEGGIKHSTLIALILGVVTALSLGLLILNIVNRKVCKRS